MENMLNEPLRGSWGFIHSISQEGLQLAWKMLPVVSVITVLLLLITYVLFYTKVDMITSAYISLMLGFMGSLSLISPVMAFAVPFLLISQCAVISVVEMMHRRIFQSVVRHTSGRMS